MGDGQAWWRRANAGAEYVFADEPVVVNEAGPLAGYRIRFDRVANDAVNNPDEVVLNPFVEGDDMPEPEVARPAAPPDPRTPEMREALLWRADMGRVQLDQNGRFRLRDLPVQHPHEPVPNWVCDMCGHRGTCYKHRDFPRQLVACVACGRVTTYGDFRARCNEWDIARIEEREAERRRAENLRREAQRRDMGRIQQYSFKPEPKFFGRSKEGLFFGIEHEVECRNVEPQAFARECHGLDPDGLFYFKPDASIRRGVEIVSHPMSFTYIMRNYPPQVAEYIAQFGMKGANGGRSYNCGIHVHMSRAAFGRPYHLWKFMEFFYRFPGLVQLVAARTGQEGANGDHHFSYNKEKQGYKVRLDPKTGRHETDPDGFMRDMARGKVVSQDRHVAINTQNRDTIEVRVFRSTTNHKRLRAYIQFLNAVFYYTRIARVQAKKNPDKQMSEQGFRDFVYRQPGKYADLIGVLENKEGYEV